MSEPQVRLDSFFFFNSASIALAMDFPGATVRYSLENEEVTAQSDEYVSPIQLTHSDTLVARAFHPDLTPSSPLRVSAYKIHPTTQVATVRTFPSPSSQYAGAGVSVLTDHQKGELNFASDTEQWLGWEVDTLRLSLAWAKPTGIRAISCSFLQNHGAWIFPPQRIVVRHHGESVGEATIEVPKQEAPTAFRLVHIKIDEKVYANLEVELLSVRLPSWHQGAGRSAWIFMDELLTFETQN